MKRIMLDYTKCTGCRTCEAICSFVNEKGEFNPMKARIRVVRTVENQVLHSIPVVCMQCEGAYCMAVCPAEAISENALGARIVDETQCIGCKLCEIACPVGAITVNPDKGIAIKCTQCNGDPMCVKHCYTGALQYIPAERVGKAMARGKANKFLELSQKGGI
jgi:anaerobic carbon-monoxide dehydrogenase iron sulfur subunit